MKKHMANTKEVLNIANRMLNEWLEDLDNGIRQDESQFHMDSAVINNATPLILTAPKMLAVIKNVVRIIENHHDKTDSMPPYYKSLKSIIKECRD